ncbi:imidazole glycerol phosphate synthase subunit HisH [Rhizobium wuzhouense]|uniref:Imidazole glycerol phosphate synthase subunit HisH n=1 Tax=Rhizobium wuzhouense TaxID=1986026 RepID=A0ABX5P0F8_9HYPH|nr:imidazole glycerol phosphate synthase subunit HisH [Rhizobium wuzhouense]PYB77098.1 imidazole glycerol phosphate synthase subunit HisH [Rhizobium wuzhouense]
MTKESEITLVDYGMANMLNVARAFRHCGAKVRVVEKAADASTSDRLVVPGVGAFEKSIRAVREKGFDDLIRRHAETGRPFLGVCVGMQMLFEASEEFGEHQGLGILPGRVVKVPAADTTGELQLVPHIGWSALVQPRTGRNWSDTLLSGHQSGMGSVYFVHSFAACPSEESDMLADCLYGGYRICAAVQRGNICATQFHPERSGEIGLSVIRRFLSL